MSPDLAPEVGNRGARNSSSSSSQRHETTTIKQRPSSAQLLHDEGSFEKTTIVLHYRGSTSSQLLSCVILACHFKRSRGAFPFTMSARIPLRAVTKLPSTSIPIPYIRASRNCLGSFSRSAYSTLPPSGSESQPHKPRDLRSQFTSTSQPPPPAPAQDANQPPRKRSLRPIIYATLFLFIGMSAGQYVRLVISPPPLPPANTREDFLMAEYLHKRGEELPIVKSLTADPSWEWHDAYASLLPEERGGRLTTGPLAGARALGGFQRIFTNKDTGESVAVVWFGGAVAGWPGVTHGGLVATILDEQLGRCAIRQFPSQTGVTANLEINYRKPVLTNSYYIIRTFPQKETFTDNKGWASGRLETLDGKICAEAKGLFVVPKKYQTKVITGKF